MRIFFKILFSLFLGFISLIIVAILLFSFLTHSNNTEKKYTINVLKSKISDSPKALVVYQPSEMSSLTKDISDNIAKGLNSKGCKVTKKLQFKKDDETKAYNLGCEIGEK